MSDKLTIKVSKEVRRKGDEPKQDQWFTETTIQLCDVVTIVEGPKGTTVDARDDNNGIVTVVVIDVGQPLTQQEMKDDEPITSRVVVENSNGKTTHHLSRTVISG